MRKKLIFAAAVLLLFAATAVTFARDTATTSVSISAVGVSGTGNAVADLYGLQDVPTGIELEYGNTAPLWSPVIEQPGSITAGDIYYFNTTDYLGDVMMSLHITNPEELSQNYSYLFMQVNVRNGTSGSWAQSTRADGSEIGAVYLSLNNGYVSFVLSGDTEYSIAIDGGTFYCIDTDADGGSLSPDYYLEVKPL
jgi:hypothetical protein